MKITVDTNVLIRAVVRDDEKQAMAADKILKSAKLIAVTLPCLCEFVWVLRRLYDFDREDIASAIRALADTATCQHSIGQRSKPDLLFCMPAAISQTG